MSLTTVAATIRSDSGQANLPPSRPEKFQRSDFLAAAVVFAVTLGVYIATLAPNVTLEDSGELITGATTFGVPHPPGYPLWTMAGFLLSHLVPFGNMAWRINLLCALIGAVANGLLTVLACHSGRWLLQRWAEPEEMTVVRPFTFYAGMMVGLAFGFSDVMWGQAVIAAVHGTLNALFLILVLFFFYLWLIEPQKTHRLIYTVFVFALGLTNHHTLIQIIPAILLAVALLRAGQFWSVFLAVNLFSLSILVYLSWLSGDAQLHLISERMAVIILVLTALVSFFYLRRFDFRLFLAGALIAGLCFAYGHFIMGPSQTDILRHGISARHFWLWGSFVHFGWLQIETRWGVFMLVLAAVSLGLLLSSMLDRRLILGVFVAGWVGLMPYSYESFASSTHPPMNWGFASERAGFYYAVSRQQYPMSLPDLIKGTLGKALRVVAPDVHTDSAMGRPNYGHRLGLTFYYYGENLVGNFTVPLLLLGVALLLYVRRCDSPQVNWLIFLALAFFCVAFMLQLISPQEGFDLERNLQYKVFHVQSHAILALFMGYGALAVAVFIQRDYAQVTSRFGALTLGVPALGLSLLPFAANVGHCSQAGHWFGYRFGHDVMAPMEKAAVYYGGSDFGRFVPTYMAFVESQQPERWKRDPGFDRRDVAVITQNALCDVFYCHYIRDQYDDRFRPRPAQYTPFEKWLGRDKAYPTTSVTCLGESELSDCWQEFNRLPEIAALLAKGVAVPRPGTNDVFLINAIAARRIFEKNKAQHTFYLEQSIAMPWTYPYMLPAGLIFKLSSAPLAKLPVDVVAQDRKFWDDYSERLLDDPRFSQDDDAHITFGKLAAWHADLYQFWHMEAEEEHWLHIALALCPQLSNSVDNLSRLLANRGQYDQAIAVIKKAQADDPRNESYETMLTNMVANRNVHLREQDIRAKLGRTAKSPYDVDLNLQLAAVLQDEGKLPELNDRMKFIAGLTNWDRPGMAAVVEYYTGREHNPEAAIAFLEERARIEPKASEMVYSLAALHASLGHKDEAFKYLSQAVSVGGTNAIISAKIDPRFANVIDDARFQALLTPPASSPEKTNAAPRQPTRPKKK